MGLKIPDPRVKQGCGPCEGTFIYRTYIRFKFQKKIVSFLKTRKPKSAGSNTTKSFQISENAEVPTTPGSKSTRKEAGTFSARKEPGTCDERSDVVPK